MKTQQVLALYAAGERNFQGQDLKGCNFKGAHLAGVDFTRADIRGAKFTAANLRQARFQKAQVGIGVFWMWAAGALAIFWGILAGFFGTNLAAMYTGSDRTDLTAGLVCLLILGLVFKLNGQFGLLKGLSITLVVLASMGTGAGAIAVWLNWMALGQITLTTINTATLMVVVVSGLSLLLAIPQAMNENSRILASLGSLIGTLSVPLFASGPVATNLGRSGTVLALALAILIVSRCLDLAKRALAGDHRQSLIRAFAIATVTHLGTRFRGADLTYGNFADSLLAYADFRDSRIDYCRWDGVRGLDLVHWGESAMNDARVRALLVGRTRPDDGALIGANLAAMDLSHMDLRQVNLKSANLLDTNLRGTDLTQANLTLVKALGADFTDAILTGACIEGWAIDSKTCLANVDCRFVYRLEQPKPNSDDRERHPSSGEFEPGDFTKLFQVVLNTVELLFRNGVDRDALAKTLHLVQANIDDRIKLQSLEDKGDGFFKLALGVPEEVNKAHLHQQFNLLYGEHLQHIQANYQTQLNQAQQQIQHYQQTTLELTQILKQLTCFPTKGEDAALSEGCVSLTFWDGSLHQGYPLTADIRVGALAEPLKFHGSLPPAPELIQLYRQWQTLYRQAFSTCARIQFEHQAEITNVSHQELKLLADQLAQQFQSWLRSPSFRLIADKLREKFLPQQTIQVLIQAEDVWLRRLPWHLWPFLNDYPRAEVALSSMSLERTPLVRKVRDKMRILAILGNGQGIDLSFDHQRLQTLADLNIEVKVLQGINHQQFHDYLWDQQGWDIFYFSGHSYSGDNGNSGLMQLSPYEQISFQDLQVALREAVNQGLQLAVLNSCDGLGLAYDLCNLRIPQIVVMKEPVPDQVAHSFLDYFLHALTRGATLHAAVHEARKQLSSLEDQYPYASWLPTLFQTTTGVAVPKLNGRVHS